MASQQILFAETIAGMKKAFKRKAYDSDSDSEIEHYSNRGHKLKRRARFAHKGQLVPPEGPSAYKERVDYAGSQRTIIHRNPPLVDEDGYEIDSDDDEDRIEEAMASAAELNPYANIRLEQVLAPLTASTDLPNHPTLSKPFTSENLTKLVNESGVMMRRENRSLWEVRHLWTALCGDHIWIPCGDMIGPNDAELYTDDHVARHLLSLAKPPAGEDEALVNGTGNAGEAAKDGSKGTDTQHNGDADVSMTDGGPPSEDNNNASRNVAEAQTKDSETKNADGPPQDQNSGASNDQALTNGNANMRSAANESGDGNVQPHAAPAAALAEQGRPANNTSSTLSETSGQPPFVHPMFLPPASIKADRDLGLPEGEAEDVRRLLALFVQKQEEVCRGVRRLQDGLSKAHRLRQNVLHWSKAEAHAGVNRDMSDGEDWYDKEEWGLTEDLKKGQDDEEEDTTTTAKKTRTRR